MNYSCYLLRNIYETHKTHTYNGSTNNLKRRIRQHNGEIMGGARQTSRASGGWEYYCIMCGFPDKINALQCEWRWKHPTGSSGKRTSERGTGGSGVTPLRWAAARSPILRTKRAALFTFPRPTNVSTAPALPSIGGKLNPTASATACTGLSSCVTSHRGQNTTDYLTPKGHPR